MINTDTLRTSFPMGTQVTVTKKNGNTVTGTVSNVTAKSFVVGVDGRAVAVPFGHIDSVDVVPADDDDLLTTTEFAALFDTNAKALRVVLRRLGLGVGKGSRYGLPRTLATTQGDAIRTGLAAVKSA